MSKKKKTLLWLAGVSIAVGLALTVLLGVFVTTTQTYVDPENLGGNRCASLDCVSTLRTDRGFPLSFVSIFENSEGNISAKWNPLNFLADTIFFAALTYAVLYLRRKIK